jgi:hypothetical protein
MFPGVLQFISNEEIKITFEFDDFELNIEYSLMRMLSISSYLTIKEALKELLRMYVLNNMIVSKVHLQLMILIIIVIQIMRMVF